MLYKHAAGGDQTQRGYSVFYFRLAFFVCTRTSSELRRTVTERVRYRGLLSKRGRLEWFVAMMVSREHGKARQVNKTYKARMWG